MTTAKKLEEAIARLEFLKRNDYEGPLLPSDATALLSHIETLRREREGLSEYSKTYYNHIADVVEAFDEIKVDGKEIVFIDDAIDAIKSILQRCASLERVREAADEAIRWATGTDKHWKAEGILSGELARHEREWPKGGTE